MKATKKHALPAGFALFVVVGLMSAALPGKADAAVGNTPKISVQQAEKIAVSTLSIPSNYQLQSESYMDNTMSYLPPSYSLNYQDTAVNGSGQWISVMVDANTGEIENFNRPSPDNQFVFPIPVSADKAKELADGWARKLYPDQWGSVKSLPLTPVSGALRGPTLYSYTYERVVNGVPAPFDGFTIVIDQDGNLVTVQDHWTTLAFPSANSGISTDSAQNVYQKALNLYLSYQSVWTGGTDSKVELVYNTSPQASVNYWGNLFVPNVSIQYPVIDASTGQVIDSSGLTYQPSAYQTPKPIVSGGPVLHRMNAQWSETDALAYAQKLIGATSSDVLKDVNQNQSEGGDTNWSFTWQQKNGMTVNLSIDGTYGILTSYGQYPTDPTSPSKSATASKLTQAQITNVVTSFVKRILPNMTGSLAVIPESMAAKGESSNLNFVYQLVNIQNGITDATFAGTVNVDPDTGTVQSLYMNLPPSNNQYPNPALAVSPSTAEAKWVQSRHLTLEYLLTNPQNGGKVLPTSKGATDTLLTPKIVLVYAPTADNTSIGTFNAMTNEFENGGVTVPFTGTIQDLRGVAAAPEIQLLVDRELLSVDKNGNVHPEESMTQASFIKLLVDALGAQGRIDPLVLRQSSAEAALAAVPVGSPDYNEIGAAYSMGWIPEGETFNPDAIATRDYAAGVLARALNMQALLSHPSAFSFSPTDGASISKQSFAGDALASTLGVLPLNNGAFEPNQNLTVADAAHAVVQVASILGLEGHPYKEPVILN